MDKQVAGADNDCAEPGGSIESNKERRDSKFNPWPLVILVNAAALSVIYASQHGQTGRFSATDRTQGGGNVPYTGILTDWRTRNDYPIFDLADQEGKPVGIGFIGADGKFCVASDLRSVSK